MSTSQNVPQNEIADRRSWFGRHKFLSVLVLLVVLIGAGVYIWGWPLMKLRFHSQYQAALAEIRTNPKVAARLGSPIDTVRPFPGGSVHTEGDRGEAIFYFDIAGPKGTAKVSAKSRMMQGQWGFSQLELEFPDKQHLDLAQDMQGSGEDMPKFDPNAKQPSATQPDMPVDIALPDLPPEPEKK